MMKCRSATDKKTRGSDFAIKHKLISSDIIESLFGHFKHIVARSPHADMNRSTLLIPALCGKFDDSIMAQIIQQASHHDLKAWENKNIPYTLRKKRQVFF